MVSLAAAEQQTSFSAGLSQPGASVEGSKAMYQSSLQACFSSLPLALLLPLHLRLYVHLQAVDAVLGQHLQELERCFKQSLDSRHLSMTSGAAGAAAAGGAGIGGPGGARGLVLPTPGAAGSWQVCNSETSTGVAAGSGNNPCHCTMRCCLRCFQNTRHCIGAGLASCCTTRWQNVW
jgi:hypothetical protein